MPLVPRNAGCHLTHRRNAQDTHRQVFSNTVICEAAASSSTAFSGAVDMPKAATAIAIGILVKLVVPCPDGIAQQGWDLLCIFLSTIAGGEKTSALPGSLPLGTAVTAGLLMLAQPLCVQHCVSLVACSRSQAAADERLVIPRSHGSSCHGLRHFPGHLQGIHQRGYVACHPQLLLRPRRREHRSWRPNRMSLCPRSRVLPPRPRVRPRPCRDGTGARHAFLSRTCRGCLQPRHIVRLASLWVPPWRRVSERPRPVSHHDAAPELSRVLCSLPHRMRPVLPLPEARR